MGQIVKDQRQKEKCLIEDLERRTHGGLDVQHLDVLPTLLEERHKEIHGKLHVEGNVRSREGDVGHGKGHAHHLLHLELDGGLDGVNLLLETLVLVTVAYKSEEGTQ